jgi:predicted translin family RNA/ssDNA-binding protein
MMNGGFDPASDARFRATVEVKQQHTEEQIRLLWDHNRKRREEIKQVHERATAKIEAAQRQLTGEIDEIKSRINGAVYAFAAAAAAALWVLIKPRLGF